METNQAIHSSANLHILKPRKALNKAFLKVKPNYPRIQLFQENLKHLNPSTDTSSLEVEIDRMVYELYGLTEEDRQIIENSIN